MTNQEINEAIMRKLGYSESDIRIWGNDDKDYAYSTKIEAAWEIVEYLLKNNIYFEIRFNPWRNTSGDGQIFYWVDIDNGAITEEADTAPLAICKAFLKLK